MANRKLVKQGESSRIPEIPEEVVAESDELIPEFYESEKGEVTPVRAAEPVKAKVEEVKSDPNPPMKIVSGEEPKKLPIVARIKAVMEDVQYLQRREATGGVRFNTIAFTDVVAKLRPSMLRHGVVLLPGPVTKLKTFPVQTKSGAALYTEIIQEFQLAVVGDNPDRFEGYRFSAVGSGQDTSDKGAAKASTAAYKQALLKLFMLEIGDENEETYMGNKMEQLPPAGGAQMIGRGELGILQMLCEESALPESVVAEAYGVKELKDMVQSDYEAAKARLEARKANRGPSRNVPQST